MQILAIIPARSGSKSLPHKNIRLIHGKPLLAYSIEQALASRLISRTIVSTDSEEYAQIARDYGADVPFLRPAEFSQDDSLDIDVFRHALETLAGGNYHPEICVHLRPTHPIREPSDIDAMLQILLDNPEYDAVRSIALAKETPFKMWFRGEEGLLRPVNSEIPEAYNMPRQALPKVYLQNASIDVVRSRIILQTASMTGKKIYGYVMPHDYDIDTEADFQRVLLVLEAKMRGKDA